MTHPLALVGLLVCPITILAQQPSPVSLSLADALAIAREHNPAYLQAQHDRAPAAWGVRNAYAAFLPAVTASGGSGTLDRVRKTSSPRAFCSRWRSTPRTTTSA